MIRPLQGIELGKVRMIRPQVSVFQTRNQYNITDLANGNFFINQLVDADEIEQFIFGVTPMDETVRVGHA